MYNFFLLRGTRAFFREWVAAAIALAVGSIVFGLMCAKFSTSEEGAAFVAAALVAIPVAVMILQRARKGRLRFPGVATVKLRMQIEEDEEERKTQESFASFWRSLDPDEREGLQWLSTMIAANVLGELHEDVATPIKLHPRNVEQFEQMVLESGQREVLLAVKGGRRKFVRVRVNHRTGQVLYSMKTEDA